MDEKLWKIDRYLDFLEARRALLADAINAFLKDLMHGEVIEADAESGTKRASNVPVPDVQGTIDEEEEQAIDELNEWLVQNGPPPGEIAYELSDPATGQALAVLDLAWPDGVQRGLSERVCVLLNEPPETLATASQARLPMLPDHERVQDVCIERVAGPSRGWLRTTRAMSTSWGSSLRGKRHWVVRLLRYA